MTGKLVIRNVSKLCVFLTAFLITTLAQGKIVYNFNPNPNYPGNYAPPTQPTVAKAEHQKRIHLRRQNHKKRHIVNRVKANQHHAIRQHRKVTKMQRHVKQDTIKGIKNLHHHLARVKRTTTAHPQASAALAHNNGIIYNFNPNPHYAGEYASNAKVNDSKNAKANSLETVSPHLLHSHEHSNMAAADQHTHNNLFTHHGWISLTSAPAQPHFHSVQSLNNVIDYTLSTNPSVLERQAEMKAAHQGVHEAVGAYLPQVDLSLGIGRERTDSVTTNFTDLTLTRKERQINASQLLWDGWGTLNQIRNRQYEFQSSVFQTAEQRELTALRVTEVYLDMMRFSALTNLATRNVDVHRVTLHKVRLRYKGGAGHKADSDLAESRLSQAVSTLLASEGLLRDGKAAYVSVTNLIPRGLRLPRAPHSPRSLKSALKTAFDNSPALKVAKKNLLAAHASIHVAEAAMWPTFSLEAAYARNNNLDGLRGKNDELIGMLMMRYNIFNGGQDLARIKQAIYRYHAAEQNLFNAKRTVRENVTTAWNNLHIARLRAVQLNKRVSNTRRVLSAYQKQFELGQRSLLNLVDTERELFNARSDAINNEYLILGSTYRLLASMGTLTNQFG